jgi:hypothetical protein
LPRLDDGERRKAPRKADGNDPALPAQSSGVRAAQQKAA